MPNIGCQALVLYSSNQTLSLAFLLLDIINATQRHKVNRTTQHLDTKKTLPNFQFILFLIKRLDVKIDSIDEMYFHSNRDIPHLCMSFFHKKTHHGINYSVA